MSSVTPTAEMEKLASYQLPASCFAYIGDPAHPGTWKLPYRLINGSIDERRLPKAIQAILSNYRGVKGFRHSRGSYPGRAHALSQWCRKHWQNASPERRHSHDLPAACRSVGTDQVRLCSQDSSC